MTQSTHPDRLLHLCMATALVAIVMVILAIRADVPPTTFNAVIDAARFVTAVAAVWFGAIVIFERRLARSSAKDSVVIDLRDVDLTKTTTRAAVDDTESDDAVSYR